MRIKSSCYIYLNNNRQKRKFMTMINKSNLNDDEKREAVNNGLKLNILKITSELNEKGEWKIISAKFTN